MGLEVLSYEKISYPMVLEMLSCEKISFRGVTVERATLTPVKECS